MAQVIAGGQNPPEFLSTHPSVETRIQKVEQYADGAPDNPRKIVAVNGDGLNLFLEIP